MKLTRARVAFAALTFPALCILAVTASAQTKRKTQSRTTANPPVNRRLSRGEYVARQALAFRGAPYRFGGRTSSGFDCSGLIQAVWNKYGLLLPRTSVEQFKTGIPIPRDKMKPGDLVFFKNTYKKGISHVGIFVGGGKFVHAANSRKGVITTSLSDPYYLNRWAGARRVSLEQLPDRTQVADKPSTVS